ncbi:hypothetical protein CSHISOI_07578 [Colletotrichum shisoi]|uniref:Uncharacterized protein n=1 Tax=Colletotrichum shisoi TaxID=2078593 RepID=A0A5Q4BLP9_9PEZI|nr:hypothetical protein CSHISOI_07578 [Colletotrichum shisoi]
MRESRHDGDRTKVNRRRRREHEGDAKENDNQLLDHVDSDVPKTLGDVASDLALIRRQRFGDVTGMDVYYNSMSFSHMTTSEIADHAIKVQDRYGNDFDQVDAFYVFYNKKDRTENDLEEARLHSIENPIQPPAKGPRKRENAVIVSRRPQVDEAPPDAITPINLYGINFGQTDVSQFGHQNDRRKHAREEIRLQNIEDAKPPPVKRPRNRENVMMIGRRSQADIDHSVDMMAAPDI